MNKILENTMKALAVVGGINWVTYAFGLDLVAKIAGFVPIPMLAQVLYVGAGASAVYLLLVE